MFEYLSNIAVGVTSGAILAIGLGMIAVGNRSRKNRTMIEAIERKCHLHGLPTSDLPHRVTKLENECLKFREFADAREIYIARLESVECEIEGIKEVRERILTQVVGEISEVKKVLVRIEDKTNEQLVEMRKELLTEIRRVNGKIL